MAQNILLIQNDPEDAAAVSAALSGSGERRFEVEWLQTCEEGLARLNVAAGHANRGPNGVAAVLVDLLLPDARGMEVLDRLYAAAAQIPLVVLSSPQDEPMAKMALHRGAQDYLLKNRLDGHTLPRLLAGLIDRAASSDALFDARERARVSLNAIGEAVICTDLDGCVSYLNAPGERLTGRPRVEAVGQSAEELLRIVDATTRERIRHRQFSLAPANTVLIRADGSELAIEVSAAPIHDPRGQLNGTVLVVRESAPMPAPQDGPRMRPEALLFNDRLTQAMAAARRHSEKLAIMHMDVDDFARVNERQGTVVGDRLLDALGRRLRQRVRATDTVQRWQGHEFVLLFSELSTVRDALVCAQKVLQAAGEPHQIDQDEIRVTASTGIAIYPDDGSEADVLLRYADAALLRAKQNGRNGYELHAAGTSAVEMEGQYY